MNIIAISCLLALTAYASGDELVSGGSVYAPAHASAAYYSYPNYAFNYAVNDPHTGDNKSQWEKRNGDVVEGSYSLVEPDGNIRVVQYRADDKTGFNAVVKRFGKHLHYGPFASPGSIYRAPIPLLAHQSAVTPIYVKPIAHIEHLANAPLITGPLVTAPITTANLVNISEKGSIPVVTGTPIIPQTILSSKAHPHEPLSLNAGLIKPIGYPVDPLVKPVYSYGGIDHAGYGHGGTDYYGTGYGHGGSYGDISHGGLNYAGSHGPIGHGGLGYSGISHDEISHGGVSHGGVSHGDISYGGVSHGGLSHGGISYGEISHGGSHGGISYGGLSHGGSHGGSYGGSHGGISYGGSHGGSHGGISHGGSHGGISHGGSHGGISYGGLGHGGSHGGSYGGSHGGISYGGSHAGSHGGISHGGSHGGISYGGLGHGGSHGGSYGGSHGGSHGGISYGGSHAGSHGGISYGGLSHGHSYGSSGYGHGGKSYYYTASKHADPWKSYWPSKSVSYSVKPLVKNVYHKGISYAGISSGYGFSKGHFGGKGHSGYGHASKGWESRW